MALRALSNRLPAAYQRIIFKRLPAISSRFFSAEAISHPSNLVQIYISRSIDPYLNLSIEHFLLHKSHPDSVVLLLYTNRPCVVIGRNQNPWVEVNLGLVNRPGVLSQLRAGSAEPKTTAGRRSDEDESRLAATGQSNESNSDIEGDTDADADADDVLLVRRRSGGGTVFHDLGNVNYSVICPPPLFDRDIHAEMVARALRNLDISHEVRVNERHDIVLDVSSPHEASQGGEVSETKKTSFKISGSAYKLTRTRSLHHGTCLLSSPHLGSIRKLLRSPAAAYIKARGVESVRSAVRNVGIKNAAFERAVVDEFVAMYGPPSRPHSGDETRVRSELRDIDKDIRRDMDGENRHPNVEIIDPEMVAGIPSIRAGVTELRSRAWIYAQTPQFVFSTHPTAEDPRPRPDLPIDLPAPFFPLTTDPGLDPNSESDGKSQPGLQMTMRHGQITEVSIASGPREEPETGENMRKNENTEKGDDNSSLVAALKGLHLHDIEDWRSCVGAGNESLGRWLNGLFGVVPRAETQDETKPTDNS
ncbi:hypothetical protein F4777DRAFT_405811 [Nemania sp. FL0916]|nr:hypothetical protein F4777DRAFT_405811 [Nemania sp. FL0916]